MKVRCQADADLNQIIVAASLRRAPEVDFRAAPELTGLASLAAPSGQDQRYLFSR